MKQYDVFESEGGYRVACEVCLGGPVIDKSPWFKHRSSAQRFANQKKAQEKKKHKEWAESQEGKEFIKQQLKQENELRKEWENYDPWNE